MSALHDLLSVQRTDTAIAQANHRLTHLPEIAARREAMERLAVLEEHLAGARASLDEATSSIAGAERRSAEIDAAVTRLESQLKTVIAPREAEALQHEIATLRAERSQLDDAALEAMERVEHGDRLVADIEGEMVGARSAIDASQVALREAQDVEQAQIVQLTERRHAQALVVPGELLARYESRRAHRKDAVVAELHGSTCDACHLDLSQTERDELRRLADDEIPECPHCGCILVL
jgi:predicted  nucleic acid-binding Zn-ribbon protein